MVLGFFGVSGGSAAFGGWGIPQGVQFTVLPGMLGYLIHTHFHFCCKRTRAAVTACEADDAAHLCWAGQTLIRLADTSGYGPISARSSGWWLPYRLREFGRQGERCGLFFDCPHRSIPLIDNCESSGNTHALVLLAQYALYSSFPPITGILDTGRVFRGCFSLWHTRSARYCESCGTLSRRLPAGSSPEEGRGETNCVR